MKWVSFLDCRLRARRDGDITFDCAGNVVPKSHHTRKDLEGTRVSRFLGIDRRFADAYK